MRLLATTAVVASGVVVTTTLAGPTVVSAASFTSIPDRLYMAPESSSIPGSVAEFVGLPIGTLTFDGSEDLITHQNRLIEVDAPDGPLGCDLQDAPVGVPDYDIDDCSRVVLTATKGRISMGQATLLHRDHLSDPDGPGGADVGDDNPADWVWIYDGGNGALLDAWGGGDAGTDPDGGDTTDPGDPNDPDGYASLAINGTAQQLNDALANLVFVPDDGYHYHGDSPAASISVTLASGDPADPDGNPSPHTIAIRVLDVNGFPDLTPDSPAPRTAQPATELSITGYGVTDEDNDEDVDGDQADPPEEEEDLPDGAHDSMLLVAWLTCGQPIAPGTGFHLASAAFESEDLSGQSIADFVTDLMNPDDAAAFDPYVDAALAALEAIEPGITTFEVATSQPTDWTAAFAGVASMSGILDALSEITFRHDVPNDDCTLVTVVSDLGHNGLPLQWIPEPLPEGFEVPMLGFDWNVLEISTGELEEIDVSFDPAEPIVFDEGGAPGEVAAPLRISPATHPEFTIRWDAKPRLNEDPVLPGQAAPNEDFGGTWNNTLTIPENATVVPIPDEVLPDPPHTNVLPDGLVEGVETFVFELVPGEFAAPDGWVVTSSVPTRNVVILDDDDAPRELTVADAQVTEGDTPDTATLTFTLALDAPADGDESVTVSTGDPADTATAGVDYVALPATPVTFAPGEQQQTVSVTVTGDLDDEADETFTLHLTNPANVTLADAGAIGTIVDDDATRTVVSVSSPSVPEGDLGTTSLVFTVTLDLPAKGTEELRANTSGATPGVDYVAITDSVRTFTAGSTTLDIPVTVNGDTDVEPDELVTLTLDQPDHVNLAPDPTTASGTIENDDGVVHATIADVSVAEGDAGTTPLTFTVTLAPAPTEEVTITATTGDGTATTAGGDYAATTEALTFAAGETTKPFTVLANGDAAAEADETFTVTLTESDPLVIVDDGAATGTIVNDDISVSIAPAATVAEGDAGTVALQIEPATHPAFSVKVSTSGGGAVAGVDYVALSDAVVAVGAGETTVAVPLTTLDDLAVEGPEIFLAVVDPPDVQPAGFTVRTTPGSSISTITITDDDVASVASVAPQAITESGGAQDVSIALTNPANPGLTCAVTVSSSIEGDDTAAPTDLVAIAGETVTFSGSSPVALAVTPVDDALVEGPETFTLTLTVASVDPRCQLDPLASSAKITITDDDSPSVIAITDASVTEGDAGSLAVVMSNPVAGRTCTVLATSADGPSPGGATAGADYTALAAVPVALDGSGSGTAPLGVTTLADALVEGDETFTVTIALDPGAPAECQLAAPSTAVVTIVDDDQPAPDTTAPTVTIDQGAGQSDPTAVAPIVFAVHFSEPVTGFDDGDVALSGTAGATTADVTGSGADYTVAVSGMTGPGTVTATVPAGVATDAASNPNVASTSVDDTVLYAPVDAPLSITVPADIVRPNDPGQPGAIVAYPAATASGGQLPVSVACTPASASFFPIGTTPVTCVATDAGSPQPQEAIVTGTFTVTVIDTEPPVIADNPDLVRTTPGTTAIVTFPLPAASDNSGVAPTVTCTPVSGVAYGLGVSTVTCTAVDGAGNQASSSFTITVTTDGGGGGSGGVAPTGGELPRTGDSPAALLALGAVLLLAGLVLQIGRHRPRSRL